jgi:hypothetical protein
MTEMQCVLLLSIVALDYIANSYMLDLS